MTLSPFIERELAAGARRSSLFWLKSLVALVAALQACELLGCHWLALLSGLRTVVPVAAGVRINGAAQLQHMAGLLFFGVLLMSLLSADTIVRERREGTLGMLLLTQLTPLQVVQGKLLTCGLTSFLTLVGCLPALMLPVLAGGVTGSQAALTGLGLLNSLFVSLAAGLWMSALFRDRRYAITATLLTVGALAFGPEILCAAYIGPTAVPIARLFSLAGWMTATRLPIASNAVFLCWFILMHAMGWMFLKLAGATLASNWQDRPKAASPKDAQADVWLSRAAESQLQEEKSAAGHTASEWPQNSAADSPRRWDDDPIRWRIERLGQAEALVWPAMALNFLAQFGLLGSIVGGPAAMTAAWGFLSVFGILVIVCSGGMLAWAGARFFQDARRQLDLELLLTTPLGGRNIIHAQWQLLRRALGWPVGLLLALAFPAAFSLVYNAVSGDGSDPWFLLQPFLIVVNLCLEACSLCWVGMRFGLSSRNGLTAIAGALTTVHLLPVGLAIAGMWLHAHLATYSPLPALVRGRWPGGATVLLFFLFKNLALLGWARWSLRRRLRLHSSLER